MLKISFSKFVVFGWCAMAMLRLPLSGEAKLSTISTVEEKQVEKGKSFVESLNDHSANMRRLQEEEEPVLPTPKEVEEALQTYINAQFRGYRYLALHDADLNHDEELDEDEIRRLFALAVFFANGGDIEEFDELYESGRRLAEAKDFSLERLSSEVSNNRKLQDLTIIIIIIIAMRDIIIVIIIIITAWSNCSGDKDPHFMTNQKRHFAFHGICDLVMLKDEDFLEGQGLEIHGRSDESIRPNGDVGSVIGTAAIRIGQDVLEVSKDGSYMLNGVADAPLPANVAGGMILSKTEGELCLGPGLGERCSPSTHFDIASKEIETYDDVLNTEHAYITAHHGYLDVSVSVQKTSIEGSVGLWGTYPTKGPDFKARDGKTVIWDHNEFGKEWQVNPDDGDSILFQEARAPQYPDQCILPGEATDNARRLRAD